MPVDVQTWRARIGTYNAGRLSAIRARYHLPKSIESIKGLDVPSGCGTVLFGLVMVLSLLDDLLRGRVRLSDVISAVRVRCGRTKLVSSTKMANVLCGTAVLLFVLAMALCLLLLQSGDVERNPGPLTSPQPSLAEILKHISPEKLDQPCRDDHLSEIALHIVDWRSVAPFLGLTEAEEREIEEEAPSAMRRRISVLRKWKRKMGKQATYRKLTKTFWQLEMTSTTEEICCLLISREDKDCSEPSTSGIAVQQTTRHTSTDSTREDPRETHHLCRRFATAFRDITKLLDKSVDIVELKEFISLYGHPLYPEKSYVKQKVYKDVKSTRELLKALWPQFINYMHYYLLEDIIEEFGCEDAMIILEKYKQGYNRKRRLCSLPAPLTDGEIEQSTGVKKVKVEVEGSTDEMTVEAMEEIRKALEKATGIKRACITYAFQDPGCVILSFLIPESISYILHELCVDDLTILADSGVLRLELVDELVIENIQRYATAKATAEPAAEGSKRASLEYYLQERVNLEQYSYILRMLTSVSVSELLKVITDDFLTGFAWSLSNWKNLAPYFGLTEVDVQQIAEYCPDEGDQKYQALLHWKKHEGDTATYHTLLETLLLHGEMEEVAALLGRLGPEPAALHTKQWLKQKYLAHDPWQRWRDIPKLMQFDQRLGELQKNASDQLKELDYSTCYETMDQFPSEITPVSVKSLVNKINDLSQVFLIKGPPGMGKSHLMANICRYWALGFGMREYTLVFWVKMAALQQPPETLNDILRGVLPESKTTADLCRWIEDKEGGSVMFILDGWGQQQPCGITNSLISKEYLSKSTIVVTCTSNPPPPKRWYQYDLLGLTSTQVSKLVTRYHSTDPLKTEALLLHLASNPDIKQLASFPVYLYAILFISDHVSPSDLPDTWTEMFTLLTLLHFQQPLVLPECMANFPENLFNVESSSTQLCKKAFNGLEGSNYQSPETHAHKGFATFTDHIGFFNFTFPLLKHFLAAVYIHQSVSRFNQMQLMQKKQQLNFMWMFYAGMCQYREHGVYFLQQHCQENIDMINCYYEAGLTTNFPCSSIKSCILTGRDIHHIVILIGGKLKSLKFHKCCLGTEALTQLSKLSAYLDAMERTQLSFESCTLSEEGLTYLGGNTVGKLRRVELPSAHSFGSIGKKKIGGGVTYISLYEFNGTHSAELSTKKGEILRVYNATENGDWVHACREDGREGLVPANHIRRASSQKVQALDNFVDTSNPDTLQFKKEDFLHLFTDVFPGENLWLLGTTADGKTGLVPSKYVYKSE